jgi:hypothetical protein
MITTDYLAITQGNVKEFLRGEEGGILQNHHNYSITSEFCAFLANKFKIQSSSRLIRDGFPACPGYVILEEIDCVKTRESVSPRGVEGAKSNSRASTSPGLTWNKTLSQSLISSE